MLITNFPQAVGGGKIADLERRISALEQNHIKIFGVKRKVSDPSTVWTRWGDSVGMVCNAAVGNDPVRNDMMQEYPYSAMRPCNVAGDASVNAYLGEDGFDWYGGNGDVMLEVPLFYSLRWFREEDGEKWEYRAVSSGPVNGLKIDRMFIDGDRISDRVYLPIFNGSLSADGTKLESKAGAIPAHNRTRAQFRELCKAKGEKWCLDDVWAMHALNTLYLVMFANSNAQATLGKGLSEVYGSASNVSPSNEKTNHITIKKDLIRNFEVGQTICIGKSVGDFSVCADRTVTQIKDSIEVGNASEIHFDGESVEVEADSIVWHCCQKTGSTIGMQSPIGRVDGVNGQTSVRFMWIEDWFGNGSKFVDGNNLKNWQHYYCNNRASYADNIYTGDYFKVGYESAHASGFVSEFGFDQEWPEIEIPTITSGKENTFFSDYFHQSESGEVIFVGGDLKSGNNNGPFYYLCTYTATNSAWFALARPQCRK